MQQPFLSSEIRRSPCSGMRTPPYTPHRSKHTSDRADSPAPSIHPTETTSPAKKAQERQPATQDNVRVEELVEGDPGYHTDVELVHPSGLEEADSDSTHSGSDDDGQSSTFSGGSDYDDNDNDNGRGATTADDPEAGLNRRLSRLQCDDEQAKFNRERRERRHRRRAGSRLFKRSHSQSVKSEPEAIDIDAMGDHDLKASCRRLRRRVRSPDGLDAPLEEVTWSSPDTAECSVREMPGRHSASSHVVFHIQKGHDQSADEMDVDSAK